MSPHHLIQLCTVLLLAHGTIVLASGPGEEAAYIAPDGVEQDWFGQSIAADDRYVAVGANYTADMGDYSGSAYLFDRYTGEMLHKFLAPDGEMYDQLGYAMAMHSGRLAISAISDDDVRLNSGAVYVFDIETRELLFKLKAEDADEGDFFGHSLAMDADTLLVGSVYDDDNGQSSGSVYQFDLRTGEHVRKLVPEDGAPRDVFGWSVALENDLVVVGAPERDVNNADHAGVVYVFSRSGGEEITQLVASDYIRSGEFGHAVDIDHGHIAIGSPGWGRNGARYGGAYIFDTSTMQETARIWAYQPRSRDNFGHTIAISKNLVAIGGQYHTGDTDREGTVMLADRDTGRQITKLYPHSTTENAALGWSLDLVGDSIFTGAYLGDGNATRSGIAYEFQHESISCLVDLDNNEMFDAEDVSIYIDLHDYGAPMTDFNYDGDFNFYDIVLFLRYANECR